jgi:carbamoylphosphate synthase large subunit
VYTKGELTELLSEDMWREQEIIIQEYIKNINEYVWHAVFKNGIRLWETTFKYVKRNAFVLRNSKPETESISIESNPDTLKVFDQIMLQTNYSGPCNIDFSYDSSNLKIFEINPRFGGSLMKAENKIYLAQALKAIINAT